MKTTSAFGILALMSACALAASAAEHVTPSSKEQAEAAAMGVLMTTDALTRLRAGDTAGAIATLESTMDVNLTVLSGNQQVVRDRHVIKILTRAAAYRTQFPRTSTEPELDAHLEKFLKRYREPKP